MKFLLELNNKTTQKVLKKTFLSIFCYTLEIAELKCLSDKTFEISIAMVDSQEMQQLNKAYRQKNKPTDVLSFNEYKNRTELCMQKNDHVFLGEIILCPEYIAANAKEDGETFEYALNYITSHGILHLLNFRHGKKMFNLQKAVAQKINN